MRSDNPPPKMRKSESIKIEAGNKREERSN